MVADVVSAVIFITLIGYSAGDRCGTLKPKAESTPKFITYPFWYHSEPSHLMACEWIIDAVKKDWSIKLEVIDTQLKSGETTCKSSYQYVDVQEKDLYGYQSSIGKFCGKEKPTYYSTRNRVVIKVVGKPYERFKIIYTAGAYGTVGDEIIHTTSYHVDKKELRFNNPAFSERRYPSFVKKAWLIYADPDADGNVEEVYASVLESSLPKHSCDVNYMEAFAGENRTSPSLGKWCGDEIPDKFIAKGSIYILLHVRDYDEDTKFSVGYGVYVKNAIPMIAGIFVGVIVFLGMLFLIGKCICSKYSNKDDDDNYDDEDEEATTGHHALMNDNQTSRAPPSTSEMTRLAPTAPPPTTSPSDVIVSSRAPPPSYDDVVNSPTSYYTES